jgi:polar amino acid transport system permease protein
VRTISLTMPGPALLFQVLARGLEVTLQLAVGAALLALPLALLAGLASLSPHRVWRWPAACYVAIFRGTSALVQLYWFYFVLPLFGLGLPALLVGSLVLGMNAGAYGAEVVRGAMLAVPSGQRLAARALHLSPLQVTWRICLPQALPVMLPSMGNILIELLKNTALASFITLVELTFTAQLLRTQFLHSSLIFSIVLLVYFALALLVTAGTRGLERLLSWQRPGRGV